jgi:methylenetetrahydrofolate dehydrogenase (NADP+)/methenyltetrahydrofolate cyclohydrolase
MRPFLIVRKNGFVVKRVSFYRCFYHSYICKISLWAQICLVGRLNTTPKPFYWEKIFLATIIDGKAFSANLRGEIARKVAILKEQHSVIPGLAVVLVGEDPASQVYVRSKGKQTQEAGMNSYEHKLSAETSQEDLLKLIDQLNNDPDVHGILVQLPLPDHIDEESVINSISVDKDVDGFHLSNVGRLSIGAEGTVPCTPLGSMMMLKDQLGDLSGKKAIVVGRSNIVGKPMAALLLKESCTVTIAHSRTRDLPGECRQADIVIAAVGRPEMIKGDWIKPGATVIDVGINRIEKDDGSTKLVGDVEFSSASEVAGAITPVPGGVGPMTIACLLHNTLQQACRLNDIEVPT